MKSDRSGILVFTSSFPHPANPVYGIFVYDFVRSVSSRAKITVLAPRFGGCRAFERRTGYRIRHFSQCCPPRLKLAGNPGGILPALKKHPVLWVFLPFFLLSELICLAGTVRKEEIGVIHAHWLVPQGFLAAVYKKFFRPDMKLLITCHGSDINNVEGGIFSRLKRFTLANADRVMTVSPSLAQRVRTMLPGISCGVQPMGVDTTVFHPSAGGTEFSLKKLYGLKSDPVLFVGSLIPLKGVRELVAAWEKVLKEFPSAELLMVGGGELRAELEDFADRKRMKESIHFIGSVPHNRLPLYFSRSAAFVLPSFSEGFSQVVYESLACATPAIVSRIPVFESVPSSDRLFSFCTPGDPDSIAEAILARLRDPVRAEYGCRYVREHLSQQRTADVYCSLYEELLSGGCRSR